MSSSETEINLGKLSSDNIIHDLDDNNAGIKIEDFRTDKDNGSDQKQRETNNNTKRSEGRPEQSTDQLELESLKYQIRLYWIKNVELSKQIGIKSLEQIEEMSVDQLKKYVILFETHLYKQNQEQCINTLYSGFISLLNRLAKLNIDKQKLFEDEEWLNTIQNSPLIMVFQKLNPYVKNLILSGFSIVKHMK